MLDLSYLSVIRAVSRNLLTPSDSYLKFVRDLTLPTADHQLYLLRGALSEMGEVSDILAKSMRSNYPVKQERFDEECGDLLFYLADLHDPIVIALCINQIVNPLPKISFDRGMDLLKMLEHNNIDKLNTRKKKTGSFTK